jgi:catechol 2,3-dioxygenase-like lactoylglutathione lyase family enzyme
VTVLALDHVQLAMPQGQEETARRFYAGLLGLTEVPKPASLAGEGGAWFEGGSAKVHLGVERDFRPARKAHPGLLVDDLAALTRTLQQAGCDIVPGTPVEGYVRCHVLDPFGNRLELLERR